MPKTYYPLVKNVKTREIIRIGDKQDYQSALSTLRDWQKQDKRSELRYVSRQYTIVTAEELKTINKTGKR